jgi:hypothetical protein
LTKNLVFLNQKILIGLAKYYPVVYPGSGIPAPDFFHPGLGSIGQNITGSRILDLGSRIRIGHTALTMNFPGAVDHRRMYFSLLKDDILIFLTQVRKPQVICSDSGAAAEKHSQRESGGYHQASG